MLFVSLFLFSTGFAMAEGFVFHGGAGYHISILGTPFELHYYTFGSDDDVGGYKNMPLGLSLHGGAGYEFGSEDMFAVGGEAVLGVAGSLKPLGALHFFIQGRAFGRYAPLEYLSITGFAGVKGNSSGSLVISPGIHPVFGIRVEPLFLYLEYAIVLRKDFSRVYSHDITIGITFGSF